MHREGDGLGAPLDEGECGLGHLAPAVIDHEGRRASLRAIRQWSGRLPPLCVQHIDDARRVIGDIPR